MRTLHRTLSSCTIYSYTSQVNDLWTYSETCVERFLITMNSNGPFLYGFASHDFKNREGGTYNVFNFGQSIARCVSQLYCICKQFTCV